METRLTRLSVAWRRTITLSWPIAVQQTFTTLMRTVDIIVTGLFSPAAVAAIGLADLYAQFPLRVGLGLGTGAIALSSQDTGRGAVVTRNRAITQALLLGFLAGVPMIIVGVMLNQSLIAVLGAESEVVQLGGTYLMIVFAAAPMRIVGLVGARSLQGTGDTRTPMLVNGTANIFNIGATLGLGLGLFGLPRLGIIGVGLATAMSRTFEAVVVVGAIASEKTEPSLTWPRDPVITRQLISVSLPNFAEGISNSLANFPFNALLLLFGTEVNAAYHIGRRIYQQLTGPLYRSFSVAASIIIGQTLGEGKQRAARSAGVSIMTLGVLTLGGAGIFLVGTADLLASVFTNDSETLRYAGTFTRVFGVSMVFFGVFFPLAGSLRGAGDTRTPFYARLVGTAVFMLAFSYVAGIRLGFGLSGVYMGLILCYLTWAIIAAVGFHRGTWAATAAAMIAERADA